MNFYYHPNPEENPVLSAEESSHVVKVFRAKTGDQVAILDGAGNSYQVEISEANSRKCSFRIISKTVAKPKPFGIHIAIAPTKSADRMEWFVEKACELGVDQISIILTQRTERKKVNLDRLEKKAISAMKQSKNLWKCQINDVCRLNDFVASQNNVDYKFAAHVETRQESLLQTKIAPGKQTLVLIGPEGDFSPQEVDLLKASKFELVSLGSNVLRTETAGIAAVHTANLINQINEHT